MELLGKAKDAPCEPLRQPKSCGLGWANWSERRNSACAIVYTLEIWTRTGKRWPNAWRAP
eukprot:423200-Alexandrium_andersonii.AAC.1